MKHLLSLATTLMLWLGAVAAWADGVTVATSYTPYADITDGFYLLKTRIKSTNGYIYRKSGDNDRPMRQKPEASMDLNNIDLAYVWYVTNVDGNLVIQNASTGEYFPATNNHGNNFNNISTTSSKAAMLTAQSFTPYTNSLDGGVLLYQVNYDTKYFIHANTAGEHNLSYWEGGTAGEGDNHSVVQFAFYKLSGTISEEHITKTYAASVKLKNAENQVIVTSYYPKKVGETIDKPHSYYYNIPTFTVSDAKKTFEETIAKTATPPVTFSTPDNPTWYKLKLRNNDGNYVVYVDDNNVKTGNNAHNSPYGTSAQTTYQALNGAYWAIVESDYGVKLYNRAAKKYVTVTAEGKNKVKATMTDYGTTFYMQKSNKADFSLRYENTKGYLGDHKDGFLSTWYGDSNTDDTQNDGGSGYKVIAVDESDIQLAKTYASTISNATDAEGLVQYNDKYDNVASAKTLDQLDAAYQSYQTDNDFSDFTGYYRVRNVNTEVNRYLSSENIQVSTNGSLLEKWQADANMDRNITRTTDADNFGSQLWQLTRNAEGTYSLVNANTGREAGYITSDASQLQMVVNIGNGNGHYTFKPYTEGTTFDGYDAKSMFLMVDSEGNHASAASDNDHVVANNNQYTNKSNYWQLVKVTSVPVTIKSVGWASVAFPFAVQVPAESGVKAYFAESADDTRMTLSEITDGIIPANTGVLLTKDGGCTVNLPIVTTTTTYPNNKLACATAERDGYASKANYMLSAKTGTVGFLPSTMTLVPANKAFLPAANITSGSGQAQMLSFYIGGTVTGINAATADAQNGNDVYYDLNGRRVLYPAHGIYVTGNGKKVFIK
jgi:hypothetical protein